MNKTYLSEENINEELINYYSQIIDGKLRVEKYIFMGADHVHVGFSIFVKTEEHPEEKKIRVTEVDLRNALNNYLQKINKELIEYKFLTSVSREGYYPGEEQPIFEGIELETKEKEPAQKLTLSSKN